MSKQVFLAVWASNRDTLSEFVPDSYSESSAEDLWQSLGEPSLDRLALAATTLHLRSRVDYFSELSVNQHLGVSNGELAALSWNFDLQTITDIAVGNRLFGPNTKDYVETLRKRYYVDAMRWVCPDMCDFQIGPIVPAQ